MRRQNIQSLLFILLLLTSLVACERPDPTLPTLIPAAEVPAQADTGDASLPPPPPTPEMGNGGDAGATAVALPTRNLPTYDGTPTPDPPHVMVNDNNEPYQIHTIGAGETMGYIAQLYGSSIEELQELNQLESVDVLAIGQEVLIPAQTAETGSNFKLIPDSELVYGPSAKDFDVRAFVTPFNGYLLAYEEEVEGKLLSGPEIVTLIAHRFSVNPRLLLAALDYYAGWVTNSAIPDELAGDGYPMRRTQAGTEGLYNQLGWAANQINLGYYGRSEGGLSSFLISDGTRLAYAPDINDGTAGVQTLLAAHDSATYDTWRYDSGPDGFFAAYNALFGNPFAYTYEPIIPDNLQQPPLQLPWTTGETWYFTSGPHGGWAPGSAWAALDFAPESEETGCFPSDDWTTAMADGLVTRSDFGAVVVDMDGDGFAGTGWSLLYMHLEDRDRIPVGTFVQTGDRLGHPSCEGGFSNGTHVHVARTYNGRWISADGNIPFELNGWLSEGTGNEYDGFLTRGGVTKEAWAGIREDINRITNE